jgi:hypothetical protein
MEKVLIGLSGGINSMAVLCWLVEQEQKPEEVHLYYAHFKEHSPDTFQFVADGIRYARKHFKKVCVKITNNSVLEYFEKIKMIPHPRYSPCSRELKIEPMAIYASKEAILIDLVGYVKHELKRRAGAQQENVQVDLFALEKRYPIGAFTDEWCFEIVDKHIGWHPAIYDIKDASGKRVFSHNNCLPCKSMDVENVENVKTYYPAHHMAAMRLSAKLGSYFGRDEAAFYALFGRDLGQQETTCENCKF